MYIPIYSTSIKPLCIKGESYLVSTWLQETLTNTMLYLNTKIAIFSFREIWQDVCVCTVSINNSFVKSSYTQRPLLDLNYLKSSLSLSCSLSLIYLPTYSSTHLLTQSQPSTGPTHFSSSVHYRNFSLCNYSLVTLPSSAAFPIK